MSRLRVTRGAVAQLPRPGRIPRRGFTLAELVVVIVVLGVVAALALRGFAHVTDGVAVRGAAAEVRTAFATARALAVRRGERAAVHLDTAAGVLAVHLRSDTVLRRPLAALYRVRLGATRDSAAYGAAGMGWGGSNLRVVVRRASAVDTVVVSRLGRVR